MNRLFKAILAVMAMGSYLGTAQAQLYVANPDAGTISEYDATTGALINASLVSGLSNPHGLTLDGEILFVTEYNNGRVGKYDAKTGAAITASLITGLASPQAIAVLGNSLYVTSLDGSGTGMVGKYDAITGTVINASFISGLISPFGVVVSENKLFVACGSGLGAIGEYDATSGVAINGSFISNVADPDGLTLSGGYIWVVSGVNAPSGTVTKYNSDTGADALGFFHPLVSQLNYPTTVALSGDNLFVASPADGTISKYNAVTGAPINASFISGLKGSISGIAAVPTSTSITSIIPDEFGLLTKPETLDNFLFWGQNNLIEVALLLIIGALSLWALIGFFRSRVKEQPVEAIPGVVGLENTSRENLALPIGDVTQNPTCKSSMKPILIGGVLTALLLVGIYAGYQMAVSIYISKINEFKEQTRKEVEAEQARIRPAPDAPVAPTLVTLPAVLVDPENFKTENNWLACTIGQRIASFVHLALHQDEASQPDIQVHAQVKAEEHHVHLEITGFSSDLVTIDLKPDFAWDPQGYAVLVTKLIGGNTLPDSSKISDPLPDELTTLLQLTGPNLAREDVTLSGLLQKHPSWSAAHEEAALLLVALALRDRASEYTDYRPMLCRATAHLALAQTFRGSTPPTWAGEIADAGIRALSGREVDATAHLDALATRSDCTEVAKTWISVLRLRAKDDWRLETPTIHSPLLLKIAWFQTLNDNLTALGALRRLEKLGTVEEVSDWGHASLANQIQGSVETGNQFCTATTAQELHELAEALQLEDAVPDPAQPIGTVLSEPLTEKLYVGRPSVLKIIGPDMFKAFARQHLLMEFERTYFWLRDALGTKDEAEKFRSATSDGFAGMRRLEHLGFFAEETYSAAAILSELHKENKTWEPWEIANGKLPGNPNLVNIHPDIDTLNTFYQDGLPFGTAYDLYNRMKTLYIGATFHKKQAGGDIHYNLPTYPYAQDLRTLNPSSYTVFALDKDTGNLFQLSKPWWDYDLRSIQDVEKLANSLDDEDYTMLLQKHAALEPDAYFQLGKHLRGEGKDDQAADVDRKGFEQAYDDVLISNSVGPLVDYYYNHNRKDEAEMVAKRAAEVYSEQGLIIYSKLLEKLGRLSEAEENAKAIADRYDDKSVLDGLYAAHKDYFQDQNKVLLDKAFPHGLQKVTMSSFTTAPTSGCVFTSESTLLQEAGLQVGDVVVALDGYRVESEDQYSYVRALTTDSHMDLIIWRIDRYLEVHASAPDRKFQVGLQTYQYSSK